MLKDRGRLGPALTLVAVALLAAWMGGAGGGYFVGEWAPVAAVSVWCYWTGSPCEGEHARLREASGYVAQGYSPLQTPGEHLAHNPRLVLLRPQIRRVAWPPAIGAVAESDRRAPNDPVPFHRCLPS